jgi:hypothetical protein
LKPSKTLTFSRGSYVAETSRPSLPPRFRLLLDQGFPKPPGFAIRSVDDSIEVLHLFEFDPALSQNSTPDWVLYCVAEQAGFDALVTRDLSQTNQLVEMYVLSRLQTFTVITWKRPIEDPVREWGQLLAYLPEVKRRLAQQDHASVILLPAPSLTAQNLLNPNETIGMQATRRAISNQQARAEALAEIQDWIDMTGADPAGFGKVL